MVTKDDMANAYIEQVRQNLEQLKQQTKALEEHIKECEEVAKAKAKEENG